MTAYQCVKRECAFCLYLDNDGQPDCDDWQSQSVLIDVNELAAECRHVIYNPTNCLVTYAEPPTKITDPVLSAQCPSEPEKQDPDSKQPSAL